VTTFAEKAVIYSDGQINVMPLPEAIMANGFIPETRDAPGMPLAAQHLNWLFRDLYRRVNESWLPAWAPIPCPMATVPEGYLKCNGAAFDKTKYPELAKGYPSGVLPDLRGEFIRGWDDGRGVDAGRGILSSQENKFQNHYHCLPTTTASNSMMESGIDVVFIDNTWVNASGSFAPINLLTNKGNNAHISEGYLARTYSSHINNMGLFSNETRPRNIAFLYIVRAA